MTCPHCRSIDKVFDQRVAEGDLRDYHARGPRKTTRLLLEGLQSFGIEGSSLLDIGGGVGVIQHELLNLGASQATAVDASSAYLKAARQESERQGHAGRASYRFGNFVDLAEQVPPADIVTLDRVICCYPDMRALVELSSARARKLYGVVFPRDLWWIRIAGVIYNFILSLGRDSFRIFIHPTKEIEAIIRANGLQRHFYRKTMIWQIIVYSR